MCNSLLRDETGRAVAMIGTMADIRERTAGLEAANAALQREMERRRRLEKEVLTVSVREEQRLGQELHDGLGQELTGLGYLAQSLYSELQMRGAPEGDMADRLVTGIQQAMDRVRSLARGLVSVEVDPDGLASALKQLAATAETRYGLPCVFHCHRSAPFDDAAAGHELFRIVQEAVNNAARHAQAKQITIELEQHDDRVVIRVHDDGVGLRADTNEASGVGLRIMQHRAAMLGAGLEIRSAAAGGTLVTCTLSKPSPETSLSAPACL